MANIALIILLTIVVTILLLLGFIYIIKCCCSSPSDRNHDLEGDLAAQPSGNPSNEDGKSATSDRSRAGQKPAPAAVQPVSEPPHEDAKSVVPDTPPAAQKIREEAGQPFDGCRGFPIIKFAAQERGEEAGQPFDGGRGFQIITFAYHDLEEATGGFSNKLGEGAFGEVYEGVLGGRQVAVKKLKDLEIGRSEGAHGFQTEIETISRTHHRNLVELIGYCMDQENKLLVYEFVPNKSLSFHLYGNDNSNMIWPIRMKIAIGSAKGLRYLHVECKPRIIHRDIKAANVLLEEDFEPKLADFGLAKWFPDSVSHVSTDIKGTFGYIPPECNCSRKLTEKYDVYSFGVMLLELTTGKHPLKDWSYGTYENLAIWARPQLKQARRSDSNYDNFVDPKLKNTYNEQEMTRMIFSAAACICEAPEHRPCISTVLDALERENLSSDDLWTMFKVEEKEKKETKKKM